MSEEKNNQSFFTQDADQVFTSLNSSTEGLSDAEAASRLEKNGPNEIKEGERKSTLQKFLDQFKDLMIIILLIAAALSLILEGSHGLVDAIIILAVVLINAIMGVVQENKAEDAIDSLKKMSSSKANVRRDGEVKAIDSKDIVVGDIVILEAGDVVPADLRLFKASSLQIEEAALTGESVPVTKDTATVEGGAGIGDRLNMGFSSTNVTYGRGEGVVTATAMDTEVGNIAEMLENVEGKTTPLQENMNELTRFLTYAIVIIAVVIFFLGLLSGFDWITMLLTAISIAVAALPEGLPAISTIILALGAQKMADRRALVRKLPAVETLGGTEVICSDKTGTLTQNKMTIEKVYYNGELHDASEDIDHNEPVFRVMNMANDSTIAKDGSLAGDPTETAMIQFGFDKGYDVRETIKVQPRVGEVPFDSDRKMSTTVHETLGEEQSHDKVVAMTGDGVNDAPSLKQADIGIGMGIPGTEVSKGASDMVLADDNFATIITAIEEGRKVFSNIQKAVQFLLSANLGEVMTLFVATMLGWTILEPIHILWINLVTDTFPAIALGLEAAESDVMEHKPRGRSGNLLSNGVLPSIIYQGIYEGAVTLFVFWYGRYQMGVPLEDAEAMAFLTLAFIQLFHAYNSKSVFKSLFASNPFDNKWLNIAVLASTVLMLITVFVPGLNDAFGTVHLLGDPMAMEMWTVILLAAASVVLYVEIGKFIIRATGWDEKFDAGSELNK